MRLLLAILVLLQSVPVTVLASSTCRVCDHGGAAKGGVHCPIRTAVKKPHCHGQAAPSGAVIRSVGCTCGERAGEALRGSDPGVLDVATDSTLVAPSAPVVRSFVPVRRERVVPPPDRPPRRSSLHS